jgi:hypothetical protein
MASAEYLVSYGLSGEFGRFAAPELVECAHGDRVVVKSRRGVEVGSVLCSVTAGHVRVLGAQPVRPLLRRATGDDETQAERLQLEAESAFAEARRLTDELRLSLEIMDVELLAEPLLLVVHYLGGPVDYRDLVHGLSTRFQARIEMLDLSALPGDPAPDEDEHGCGGCGAGGCGSGGGCAEGGCGSCGDGGCGTTHAPKAEDLHAHFAELRVKMAARHIA